MRFRSLDSLGFRVYGFRVWGFRALAIWGAGFRVEGLGIFSVASFPFLVFGASGSSSQSFKGLHQGWDEGRRGNPKIRARISGIILNPTCQHWP